MLQATYFGADDERDKQLKAIVNGIARSRDRNNKIAEFTEKFDRVRLTSDQFRISNEDFDKAHKEIDKALLKSIGQAVENVRKYQTEIFAGNRKHPGIKYTPIKRIGICVPGASAPLPSTVIMTAVPAQVARVKEIVVVSPPRCPWRTTGLPLALSMTRVPSVP